MTDRIRTLHITLDKDTRVDDVEIIKNAILMIKGVANVQNGDVVGLAELMQRETALREFVLTQMHFLQLAIPMGSKDMERYRQVKDLLDASHKEKFGIP